MAQLNLFDVGSVPNDVIAADTPKQKCTYAESGLANFRVGDDKATVELCARAGIPTGAGTTLRLRPSTHPTAPLARAASVHPAPVARILARLACLSRAALDAPL